jgi:hypothetical protein
VRFRHPDGSTVHLAYCSNVHQAEDLDGLHDQLARFAGPVRQRLGIDRLGLGLWLAAEAADALGRDPGALARLRAALDRHGLEVVTLNGFPYQAFHAPVVKRCVYMPDWTDPLRAAYTQSLARVLAALLPDDVAEGSISTLPLGWRTRWDPAAGERARRALAQTAEHLAALEAATGRRIRVGLEPEPGCAVETTEQAVRALAGLDTTRLGVCLDTCHLAVQFEDPATAVACLDAAGVPLVKAQLSVALRATDPEQARAFAEPRFLHQARERLAGGVAGVDDLPEALDGGLPGAGEWRVHFHLPVHAGGAESTQPELHMAMQAILGGPHPATRDLEVETYTWSVLPKDRRPTDDAGLVAGLAAELRWASDQLVSLGLEPL